ncbi:hypothetical protein QUF75_10430 [Desulfococcaceae bacterium HSG7]|nr:hypothetical protein [Desulfococcaceae bacterium HSG7]
MFGLLTQKNGAIDLEIGLLRYQHERYRILVSKIKNSASRLKDFRICAKRRMCLKP